MSGGVDSAVAAARAVDAGHDVVGVHLALSRMPGTLRTVRRSVVVDTTLGAGRGQPLVDRRAVSAAPNAVEVEKGLPACTTMSPSGVSARAASA